MSIEILPLGAGQDVGRSCLVVNFARAGKTILLDCGMHMGHAETSERFPDFAVLGPDLTAVLDVVAVSHFHLDHCGALPYLTEQCGYRGPVVMTAPTRDICPLLLEDYRRIMEDRVREDWREYDFFSAHDIRQSLQGVTVVAVDEPMTIGGLRLTPLYAGHVLGACMFLIECLATGETVLYTGDFNSTADRHLGAYRLQSICNRDQHSPLRVDVLITESTYAATVRTDIKHQREQDLLRKIERCVLEDGGKVLVPTFALGRAQELCMLVDQHWQRTPRLQRVPVYLGGGLGHTALEIFKRHLAWTNEATQRRFHQTDASNTFDFQFVRPWRKNKLLTANDDDDSDMYDNRYAEYDDGNNNDECKKEGDRRRQPMVLFTSPGMLHSGHSLQVFLEWAPDPRNLLIIPGYCVKGTVGARVLAGHKTLTIEAMPGKRVKEERVVDVRCQVANLSFSAHADAGGILQLVRQVQPRHVVLVHGEAAKMQALQRVMLRTFPDLQTHTPANGSICRLPIPSLLSMRSLEYADPWRTVMRQEIQVAAEIVAHLFAPEPDTCRQLLMMSVRAQWTPDWPQAVKVLPLTGGPGGSEDVMTVHLTGQSMVSLQDKDRWGRLQMDLIRSLHPYGCVRLLQQPPGLLIGPSISVLGEEGPVLLLKYPAESLFLMETVVLPALKNHFP